MKTSVLLTTILLSVCFSFLKSNQLYGQQKKLPPLAKEKYNDSKQVEDEIGFSHAIKSGKHLYISGVVAVGDMPEQIKEIMETINRTLARYHANFSNVLKETIYTTNIEEFKKFRSVRNNYYGGNYPASTWVEVKQLYLPQYKVSIEIEAILPEE